MEKLWCVYEHTNLNDGKKYIGITSQSPNQRWRNGNGYKYNPYFYNAILKYGWDSFFHEIFFSGLTEEDAKSKETELISKYNTMCEDYGYNLTNGGDGTVGRRCSEESKQKIREAHIGLKHTDDAKKRISDAMIGNQYAKGYKHTEDAKRKISKSSIGNQYAKGNKLSDVTRKKMSDSHKGKKPSAETRKKLSAVNKGRIVSDETKAKISAANKGKATRSIPVDMLTMDGEFIKAFPSAKDAYIEIGTSNSIILKVCKGKCESAGGYKWRIHAD